MMPSGAQYVHVLPSAGLRVQYAKALGDDFASQATVVFNICSLALTNASNILQECVGSCLIGQAVELIRSFLHDLQLDLGTYFTLAYRSHDSV